MHAFVLSAIAVLALILPQVCLGQTFGTDTYFDSTAATLQALTLLPTPPAATSGSQAGNIELLNVIMNTATPQMVTKALADVEPSVFDFSAVLGQGFNASTLPVTDAFFKKITINTQNTNSNLDRIYNSQGPVTPASYPSAHSLLGFIDGVVLGAMLPEKQPELVAYGVQFGMNRLILGQHWPSDVAAGQMEAGILLPDLFASAQFQSDLNQAKTELRAQQGLK